MDATQPMDTAMTVDASQALGDAPLPEPEVCLVTDPPLEALNMLMTAALVQEIEGERNAHLTYETLIIRILKRMSESFRIPWNQVIETTRHCYVDRSLHARLERMWQERSKPVTLEEQHCVERILGRDYIRMTDLIKLAGCMHKFARVEKDVWSWFAVDGYLGDDPKRYVDMFRCDEGKAKHVQMVRKWYDDHCIRGPTEMKETLEHIFHEEVECDFRTEYVEAVGGPDAVKLIKEWLETKRKKVEGETSRKRARGSKEVELEDPR